MAAMSITKNAISHLSRAFPHSPSISIRSSRNVSRVFFVSASNYSDWKNAAERDSRADWLYDDNKSRRHANNSDMSERARESMNQGMGEAKDRAHEMKERAKEYAHDMNENTRDAAGTVADKSYEGASKATDTARDYAQGTKEAAQDAGRTVADKSKEGANKAAETAQNFGEKARQTVQDAWEATKDTGQKIKETVVGKGDDDEREKTMDEYVVDLRKDAGKERDEKKDV